MKKLTIETKLDFKTFVEGMEKPYSGSGNGKTFTFSTFGGKEVKDLIVSQDLMLAYDNFRTAKQVLINQLSKEK